MPRLTPNTAPPPDYYADNLLAVATHVRKYSDDLLGPASPCVSALVALSTDAKRLMARLISRTTPVIRIDSLNYSEVGDLDRALQELNAAELIELDAKAAADTLLDRLKVAELKALFPELVAQKGGKKDRKRDLVGRVLTTYTDLLVHKRCLTAMRWLRVDTHGQMQRLQLAYFGSLYRDLTEFVMRDLGTREYEPYDMGDSARAFDDATQLSQYLELQRLQGLPAERRAAALDWLFSHPAIQSPTLDNPGLERRRNKLLIDWGRDFERSKRNDYAHACFQHATEHPARERRVRMLIKDGDEEASKVLLCDIENDPWSEEERLFARRMGERLRKPTAKSQTQTKTLAKEDQGDVWRESVWHTPHPKIAQVELTTGRLLTLNGGQAWHTENALLQSLLGLAFWDIVFAPEPGMFTHPFQTGPRDLYWPDFRARRAAAIDQRLEECASADKLWTRIDSTVAQKTGRATRLVHWGLVTHKECEILRVVRESFSAAQLCGLFDYMLDDLKQLRSGMPDLFVAYGGGRFELVEVKGPTDQLQPNQRVWLSTLRALGIPCRVVKHKYVAQSVAQS